MKKLVVILVIIGLLLAACGGGEDAGDTAEQPIEQVETEFKTPLPEAEEAKVQPTDTPVPPPPTPTPRPTDTPAPTPTPEPTSPPEPTAETEAEATEAPPTEAPSPEPTVPELPPVTDEMVEVPAGPFVMGSDDADPEDRPAHEVDLPAFESDKFEVTNADFAAFVDATGYQTGAEAAGSKSWRDWFDEGKESHPVVKVNWNDAVAYCEWLGKRLPTEAEWEKAARGADGLRFPWAMSGIPAKPTSKPPVCAARQSSVALGLGPVPMGWKIWWAMSRSGRAIGTTLIRATHPATPTMAKSVA